MGDILTDPVQMRRAAFCTVWSFAIPEGEALVDQMGDA